MYGETGDSGKEETPLRLCVTQRLTNGVKNERGIRLLSVSMISERSTEGVKRSGHASLMYYPDFCQKLLKNYK